MTQAMHADDAVKKLASLEKAISSKESNNAALYYEMGSLFLRICNRYPGALDVCVSMLQRCVQLQPTNSNYICELGYAHVLQGR